jgi:hypothetical protein
LTAGYDFAKTIKSGDDACIVIDPPPDVDRTLSRIKADFGDGTWISLLAVVRLDVANASAHQALLAALDDGWSENRLEMPVVEF